MQKIKCFGPYETYKEYIMSDEWKEKSNYMKEHACHMCEKCGEKAGPYVYEDETGKKRHGFRWLATHHISYERLQQEKLKDLVVLCNQCHEEEHKK